MFSPTSRKKSKRDLTPGFALFLLFTPSFPFSQKNSSLCFHPPREKRAKEILHLASLFSSFSLPLFLLVKKIAPYVCTHLAKKEQKSSYTWLRSFPPFHSLFSS